MSSNLYEHTCASGTVYGLAVGPLILSDLDELFADLLPERVTKIILDEKGTQGFEDLEESEIFSMLTEEEVGNFFRLQKKRGPVLVERCLRAVKGERLSNVKQYMEEDWANVDPDMEDFQEIVEIINQKVLAYQEGLKKQGESNASLKEDQKKTSPQILPQES